MIKIYYAGRDPHDHSNYTKFAVASVTYHGTHAFAQDSVNFLNSHPELFEVAVEVEGRRFQLASGMMPIEIHG